MNEGRRDDDAGTKELGDEEYSIRYLQRRHSLGEYRERRA
jgi:hypothetical protein